MKLPYPIIISLLVLVFVFTACSSQRPESIPIEEQLSEKGYRIEQQVTQVRDYRINGWSYVDRFNVIIYFGPSTHYLITLRRPCDGLRSAGGLAVSATNRNLTDKDQLMFRPTPAIVEYCSISKIYLLEKTGKP
jgi:hypothetical protein